MYVLTYQLGGVSRRHVLALGDTVAGRAPTCELVVDDASVSRRHAQFTVTPTGCTLLDLDSRNGTFRNGDPVTRSAIDDGDTVVLGRVTVAVEHSADVSLSLSEHHELIEDPGTIYRQVSDVGTVVRGALAAPGDRALHLLSAVARTLVGSRPVNDVLTEVVQLAFDTCPAERTFLVLKDEPTGALVPRLACRRDGTDIRAASLSRTIVNRVMTDRVSLSANDAETDSRIGPSDSLVAQPVRSFMCAPLWHDRDVIGVLYVDAPARGRFTPLDLDLITALSNFAAVAIEQARLSSRVLEETRRRERLQRYHSPAVVTRIFQGGADADAPFLAQEREISVLFADIVGFTAMSERLTPVQTARLLNSFFARMADVVFENEGTLDKFIGDAVMAVFGAPLDQPDHAVRAVRTALQMRQALDTLNVERGGTPLVLRMGIHSGAALAGDIGSLRRREYTVLGDVVNTASRLESSAVPGRIVMSRATHDRLAGAIPARALGQVTLRGRHEPVDVFEPV